jgi:hypothetical protein
MVLLRYLWALPNTLIGLLFVPFVLVTRGSVRVVDGVLELHGWFLSGILRNCVVMRGGAAAMTLGHVVLARDERSLCATRRHERVHVRQCERWGPAFIPAYLAAAVWGFITGRGAYKGNHFERQAFQEDGCRLIDFVVQVSRSGRTEPS